MLPQRRASMLRIVVDEYVATAAPVGSGTVVRKHALNVSPATVRNEMAALEEEGYVTRPHISAGAVPSDRGYRYYVEFLADVDELPLELQLTTRQHFAQVRRDVEVWTRLAADALSELARTVAVATFPRAQKTRMRQIQLVYLQEFLAMLILVLQEARLRKQLIPVAEAVTREDLEHVVNKLNAHFAGLSRHQMMEHQVELTPLEKQVLQASIGMMQEEDEARHVDYVLEGLGQLLAQPELSQPARVRALVDALESQLLLRAMLTAVSHGESVRVVIGEENAEAALKPFTLVIAPYGKPGEAAGAVGIVGPTRLEYSRGIASVRYLSSLMSELLEPTHPRPTLN